MTKWIKGSIAAFAAVCLFALPATAAADASPKGNEATKVKNVEKHHEFNNHCVKECDEPSRKPKARMKSDCGTTNSCNTNYSFSPSNFTFISSTLFWGVSANNLDYAVSADRYNSETNSIHGGKVHSVPLEYDFGFKMTGVYQFPCETWELRLGWTHFNPGHSQKTRTPDEENVSDPKLFVYGRPDNTPKSAGHAAGRFEIEYNVFDITLGKECCLCDKMIVRPYAGARFLWLDQKFKTKYGSVDFQEEGSHNHWSSDYSAGGLIGGIETTVDIGCDFYLWSNFSGSIVAGKPEMKQRIVTAPSQGDTVYVDYQDNPDCLVATNFEAALGVGYKFMWSCFNMDWRLAYEFVSWDNTPEPNRFYDDYQILSTTGGKHGSLAFHGVSFTSTLRF